MSAKHLNSTFLSLIFFF